MADISRLSRLINGIVRNVDLEQNTLVLQNVKLNLGGSNTVTFSGTLSGNRTITVPDANVNLGHIASLVTLSGVSGGSTHLGTFTGSTIPDNSTIKDALQALETAVENVNITPDFSDNDFRISDNGDNTKKIAFEASGIATGTTRTITMPNANVNLADVNQAILQDGSRAMSANLSLGNFKITNLANGTNPNDAVNKSQLDAAIAGLDFQKDIDDYVADASTTSPGTGLPAAAAGQRYILASGTSSLHSGWGTISGVGDNDIVEYNGSSWFVAYDVSVSGEGALVWNKDDNYFMRWDGSSWSEFGGLAGVTAGAGLDKTGNTLFIELDTNPGLEFDVPGDGGKLRVAVDNSTIERTSSHIRVKDAGITLNKLATDSVNTSKIVDGSITESKIATDAITTNKIQNNAVTNSKIANNAVDENKIASSAFDNFTIQGGNGVAANVNHSPLLLRVKQAGESFAANTSFAVRLARSGETAGRVYKADNDASTNHNYYVIGIAKIEAAASPGDQINIICAGKYQLQSNDTPFSTSDIGKPVYLTTSGGFSVTSPTAPDTAVVRIGIVEETNVIHVMPMQLNGIN